MHNYSKLLKILVTVVAIIMLATVTASATPKLFSSYGGYEYNGYEESSQAPVTYLASHTVTASDMGLASSMNAPTSMICFGNSLFVMDSGNGRIIELDRDTLTLKKELTSFTDKSGATISLVGANGMDVGPDGTFYIADAANARILVFGTDGSLKLEITRPDEALSGTNIPFDVNQVMVGNDGTIYVICTSINTGILTFTPEGEFKVFYGSNNVTATASVIQNYFINKFLTRAQRAARANITPTNFSNMTLDSDNFVYTVKSETFMFGSKDVVQCLNYRGGSILDPEKVEFGELEADLLTYYWDRRSNSFVDIDVDSDGIINLLDAGYGRVYQYTVDGDFIGSFGGLGNQNGTFSNPVAIETSGNSVYVLDKAKNLIQVFDRTEYGLALRKAFLLAESTDLDARLSAWQHVLKLNSNSTFPYYGIGLVYDEKGMYKEAMDQFKIAGAQTEYSKSFKQYRTTAAAENIIPIIAVIAVIVAAILIFKRIISRKMKAVDGTAYSPLETKWGLPIYTLFHPVDAFDQFKDRKTESPLIATIIVFLWFLGETFSFFCTGFIFNTSRVTDYQLFITIFKTFGLFVLFAAANWSVCTLLNGKGTFKEIYCSVAYSLVPYIFSIYVRTLLSNVLTKNEAVFLSVITTVGLVWSALILLSALVTVHEYSFLQTLSSLLLTVFAMAVIGFLMILFYTLMLQVFSFIKSLIEEIKIR